MFSVSSDKIIPDDTEILRRYLGVSKIPCVIKSPLREERNPSFSINYKNGKILWYDFGLSIGGDVIFLLEKLWNKNYADVIKILSVNGLISSFPIDYGKYYHEKTKSVLKCKIREWRDYDINFWSSFGIPLNMLKMADVYPISHKFIYNNKGNWVFAADKYAYSFFEFKDGKETMKIYQPYNLKGFKWSSSHSADVISLWTKIPKDGKFLFICSSLKDALCLWSNTSVPCISMQGEGYFMKNSVACELKSRFKHIFVLYDNDLAGIKDSKRFCEKTGFRNLILPDTGYKDVSDLYKGVGRTEFLSVIKSII